MSSVDAWYAVAQGVAACPEAAARERLVVALAALGLSDDDRAGLRTAPGPVPARLAAAAGPSTPPVYDVEPAWTAAELDRARAAAEAVHGGGVADPDDLAALAPDPAGALVGALLAVRDDAGLASVLIATSPVRYPVPDLLVAALRVPQGPLHATIVAAVALSPELRLLRGIADAIAAVGPDAAALAGILGEVARARREAAAAGPYRWWPGPRTSMAVPPGDQEEAPVLRGPGEPAGRAAYARLDVATGTTRPDVVVVDQPFTVTVGLQARRDGTLVSSTTPLEFAPGETVDLDVTLLYDPTSIAVTGSPRARLSVGDLTPYPATTIRCVALYGEELATERRLGLQLHRDGQVVAVAWRTLVAVAAADRVDAAPRPPSRPVSLLDLDPLLGEVAPDLVVSVCRADSGADTFVWTAYAAEPGVEVPDLPSACILDGDVAGFALETRRSIQFSTDPAQDFLGLAGRARRIGRAVPEGVRDALRTVVATPGRSTAPAVLLLTEELSVPWELAAFDPPLASAWGGTSPFLGAHAAISRWPLTEHRPRPRPRSAVAVHGGAVLTADYAGVPGWGRLDSAVAEAAQVATLFTPPATVVEPEIWAVIDLFRGAPAADVLHVALHGQFDAQGAQEGIVLLAKSPAGGATAQFLTPPELETGHLEQGPFVFLNACQVGSDERVLGDYGGFASTLLRIGAAGVIAPLWNVRDDVAAAFAASFYAATWTATEAVSVAEAVRALRATYTEAGVRAGTPGLHATLVAYQVFGHPRLRLVKG